MFPNYKRTWYGAKKPDGWEDRGRTCGLYSSLYSSRYRLCELCNSVVHVGKQKDKLFLFCPLCMVIVSMENGKNI